MFTIHLIIHTVSVLSLHVSSDKVLLNTGGIRFDLLKGNFTLDDEKIVSPFQNAFLVLKDILYGDAKIVLDWLNTGRYGYLTQDDEYSCGKAWACSVQQSWKQADHSISPSKAATVGYVTYDGTSPLTFSDVDFGSDGDDTVHTALPYYDIPYYVQSTLVPDNIQDGELVDLIFSNFSAPGVNSLPYSLITGYFYLKLIRTIWTLS